MTIKLLGGHGTGSVADTLLALQGERKELCARISEAKNSSRKDGAHQCLVSMTTYLHERLDPAIRALVDHILAEIEEQI